MNKIATLHIDVSRVSAAGRPGGISRTVLEVARALLAEKPPLLSLSFVGLDMFGKPVDQNRWAIDALGLGPVGDSLKPYSFEPGDILLGLDLSLPPKSWRRRRLKAMADAGVRVYFVVYDILPIEFPEFFRLGKRFLFARWLKVISAADGLIAISEETVNRLRNYIGSNQLGRDLPISVMSLGPFLGKPTAPATRGLSSGRSFLMVGTLEPRKDYAGVLDVFERLWREGNNVSLTIVGNRGWKCGRLVRRIRRLKEFTSRLTWLEKADDHVLISCYQTHDALLVNSKAEGFGLPIVEALNQHLPVLCPLIAPFTELKDFRIHFFEPGPASLEKALRDYDPAQSLNEAPTAETLDFTKFSWQQAAREILATVGRN